MALEKSLFAVSPQLFTSDGTEDGRITITGACELLKVKQKVKVSGTALDQLDLEVKRVVGDTVHLGPQGGPISDRTDLSAYTTAAASFIYAIEQKRPSIPFEEYMRAVYAEEPTVATRVFNVDECGNPYTVDNPFPVQLSDGSINIGTVNAELEVQLSHLDNDPDAGDVHDSVRIGDGTDLLEINPDGSINVVGVTEAPNTPTIAIVSAPTANTEVSYVIPTGTNRLFFRVRRGVAKSKFAFVSGDTNGSDYVTLMPGNFWMEDGLDTVAGLTLYIQTNKPSQEIEVLTWQHV